MDISIVVYNDEVFAVIATKDVKLTKLRLYMNIKSGMGWIIDEVAGTL